MVKSRLPRARGTSLCLLDPSRSTADNKSHKGKGLAPHLIIPVRSRTMFSMANVLSAAERTAVVAALVEGNSQRSVCRMTGVARNTVAKLG